MSASFTCAAVYKIEAECRTPLRTGGTSGDPQQVLRRRDGTALIQGASIAGALRGWLTDDAAKDALFGNQKQAGRLVVTDGVFQQDADQQTRPRLHIDNAAAVGVDGEKFDTAHIAKGSKLNFSLIWMGMAEQKAELDIVEQLLSAMNAGAIRLGAQKTNGFGRLSLTAARRLFDLIDPADRESWLADKWDGEPLKLEPFTSESGVKFTVTGWTQCILVKTAPVYADIERGKGAYIPNLSEGGQALLPGSSIKGAVRARAEYIAKVLGLRKDFIDQYFGRNAETGDNGLPGQVRFEDGMLSGQKKKISRIRIDRFTGGVQRGGLFTEEPISTNLTLQITAPEEPALCGLLLYALRDLGLGLYNLGSGWAIGRGLVEVQEIEATAPGGKRAALRFGKQRELTLEDPAGLMESWMNALEEVRHEE